MGRGRKIATAAAGLLLLAGLGMLIYPHVCEFFYAQDTTAMKEEFLLHTRAAGDGQGESSVASGEQASTVDVEGLYAYLKAQNDELYEKGQAELVDAFSYQQPAVDLSAYGIYDNCVGFVSVPSIGVDLPIYLGANDYQMSIGAVHLTQTSYPIGGNNTNSVLAAHRGSVTLPFFRNIDQVQIGDEVVITNFKETLHYRASEIKIIQPSDSNEIRIQKGRDMITLITCNPLWDNYERYVVYCERVEG